MPRVVATAYAAHITQVNCTNSIWARNVLPGGACRAAGAWAAREAVARQVGCKAEEVAVTRSGAEVLQMLIVNYKPLKGTRRGHLLRFGLQRLILSRQNLPHFDLQAQQLANIRRGGYVLADSDDPAVTLLATGSEVALSMQAREHFA